MIVKNLGLIPAAGQQRVETDKRGRSALAAPVADDSFCLPTKSGRGHHAKEKH